MNNWIRFGIVFFVVGLILLIIGIAYKGYSNENDETENWKRVLFWGGLILTIFGIIIVIIGVIKKKKTE